MHYLTVCCIARDENKNIKEWLAYHAALGVEHFYIYDNMSAEPIEDFLRGFADKSQVTCIKILGEGMQMKAYKSCMDKFGSDCRWMAFIDLDEFICLARGSDLRPLLAEYEQYGALVLNWKIFSSSGHLQRPPGLVMSNYTQYLHNDRANFIVKCIAQPRRVNYVFNPHILGYKEGHYAVNTNHIPAPKHSSFCLRAHDKAWINHYQCKSQRDFEDKQRRGRGDWPKGEKDFPYDMFYNQASQPWREDRTILRFVPLVEKMLKEDRLRIKTISYASEELLARFNDVLINDSADLEATEIHLCHASLYYEEEGVVWWARAYAARCRGELEKAFKFAEQGLKLIKFGKLYEEYFYLAAQLGKYDKASAILEYMEYMLEHGSETSMEALKQMRAFLVQRLKQSRTAI